MSKTGTFLLALGLFLLLASSGMAQIQIPSNEELEDIIVAVGVQGISIFNVSDPTNPKRLSQLEPAGWVRDTYVKYDVFVKDNYAYVANDQNGLVIVDISDPASPKEVGHYDTAGWAWGVYVKDNYAYVADTDNGIVILDISNPYSPKEVGHYNTAGLARSVYVKENYAYVADDFNGLVIVDISNPKNLTLTAHIPQFMYIFYGISGN
ncbi:MAG: hypothetical protein PWQ78_124 [Petrotoga sp.]|jgi:hypothetical protein|nr:hypothetical protein [Petrotoga sp.]